MTTSFSGLSGITPFRVNAHIHLPPNFSAFGSVSEAVELAHSQGLGVLGASNYYDFTVYREFGVQARAAGIYPLFGLEIIALLDDLQAAGVKINDPGNPGKMYLCGKGITRFAPENEEAARLLGEIRAKDSERMARMTTRLAKVFAAAGLDLGLDEAAVKRGIVEQNASPLETVYLQERHVAQAFQEALFDRVPEADRAVVLELLFGAPSRNPTGAAGVQNEIRSHLMKADRPAYEPETFVGFEHAYRSILALGGIPCYPVLADGANPICAFEDPVDELVLALRQREIHCAEVIPLRNTPEILARYVTRLRQAGIVVTAGTEHNTPDLVPLEPTCLGGVPVPEALMAIFREGACVIAAHQERAAHMEAGFVDATGRPAAGHASAEERIRAFAAEGAQYVGA